MKALRWILALFIGIGGCFGILTVWWFNIGHLFLDDSVDGWLKVNGVILWASALFGLVAVPVAIAALIMPPRKLPYR